ncbi:hypothetical protein V6N13_001054 [Hibiscus sabdariffa]|uniref:Uncharacterized protein n=1 Tax=Hibiscus sabdariffa TaxID=183260 RepID=A0ABR2G818_9ROSI
MEMAWSGCRHMEVGKSLIHKLRALKVVLREWNSNSLRNVDTRYKEVVDEIDEMENKLNGGELSSCELKRKRELHTQLWSISHLRESI